MDNDGPIQIGALKMSPIPKVTALMYSVSRGQCCIAPFNEMVSTNLRCALEGDQEDWLLVGIYDTDEIASAAGCGLLSAIKSYGS